MDGASKRRFDAVGALRTGLWNNFNERRQYEWKLSLGLWSAAALSIGNYFFGGPESIEKAWIKLVGQVAPFIIIFLHYSFLKGLSGANALDRKLMKHDENILRALAEAKLPLALEDEIRSWHKKRESRFLGDWSFGAQFGITVVLYTVLFLLISSISVESAEGSWERSILEMWAGLSPSTLSAFFGALAQSAATLASIIAVFSVFRLESNRGEVSEQFGTARFWLEKIGIGLDARLLPREMIEKLLLEFIKSKDNELSRVVKLTHSTVEQQAADRTYAQDLVSNIQTAKAFFGELVHRMGIALIPWGLVFGASMISLLWVDRLEPTLGGNLALACLAVSLVAALMTKWFVQFCLRSPWETS